MVKDLTTLLRDSAAHPPADGGSDLAEVVRLGRARVRRRRTVAIGGAVASVAVVAVTGTLLGRGLGDPVAPDPVKQLEPVGPVVHLDDAVPGVPGRDWSSLTSLTNDNLDKANGLYLSGVTPDGQVLVKDGPHGVRNTVRWGLLDPTTGETAWLSEPSVGDLEGAISLEEHRLVFWGYDQRGVVVVIHDRDSGGWSVPMRLLGDPMEVVQVRMGPDNRVYYTLADDGGAYEQRLWSRSLDTPDALARDEHRVVGDFGFAGDRLVHTATTNEPNDRITVVDLGTGEERSFDPRSGDDCNQLSLQVAGEHIALGQYCGLTNGGQEPLRDDRVQIIGLDGSPVVTVQGNNVQAGTVSPDGVGIGFFGSIDDQDGAQYVWSFDRGELVRVADSMSKFSLPWLDSDAMMWHESVNDGHGTRQFVATVD